MLLFLVPIAKIVVHNLIHNLTLKEILKEIHRALKEIIPK